MIRLLTIMGILMMNLGSQFFGENSHYIFLLFRSLIMFLAYSMHFCLVLIFACLFAIATIWLLFTHSEFSSLPVIQFQLFLILIDIF